MLRIGIRKNNRFVFAENYYLYGRIDGIPAGFK